MLIVYEGIVNYWTVCLILCVFTTLSVSLPLENPSGLLQPSEQGTEEMATKAAEVSSSNNTGTIGSPKNLSGLLQPSEQGREEISREAAEVSSSNNAGTIGSPKNPSGPLQPSEQEREEMATKAAEVSSSNNTGTIGSPKNLSGLLQPSEQGREKMATKAAEVSSSNNAGTIGSPKNLSGLLQPTTQRTDETSTESTENSGVTKPNVDNVSSSTVKSQSNLLKAPLENDVKKSLPTQKERQLTHQGTASKPSILNFYSRGDPNKSDSTQNDSKSTHALQGDISQPKPSVPYSKDNLKKEKSTKTITWSTKDQPIDHNIIKKLLENTTGSEWQYVDMLSEPSETSSSPKYKEVRYTWEHYLPVDLHHSETQEINTQEKVKETKNSKKKKIYPSQNQDSSKTESWVTIHSKPIYNLIGYKVTSDVPEEFDSSKGQTTNTNIVQHNYKFEENLSNNGQSITQQTTESKPVVNKFEYKASPQETQHTLSSYGKLTSKTTEKQKRKTSNAKQPKTETPKIVQQTVHTYEPQPPQQTTYTGQPPTTPMQLTEQEYAHLLMVQLQQLLMSSVPTMEQQHIPQEQLMLLFTILQYLQQANSQLNGLPSFASPTTQPITKPNEPNINGINLAQNILQMSNPGAYANFSPSDVLNFLVCIHYYKLALEYPNIYILLENNPVILNYLRNRPKIFINLLDNPITLLFLLYNPQYLMFLPEN